jgi:tetratricopeptide (TPR) repeat protein
MKHYNTVIAAAAAALLALGATTAAAAGDPAFDAQLLSIQQAWATANYDTPEGDARAEALLALEKRAEAFVKQHPGRAEALIWEGIIESSCAGAKGGLGALGLAKEARGNLEAALKIDPKALDGSAYTSLGTLYYKVPGFPLGFGDDDKAQEMLRKALELNPEGIDPNYFYGEFLYEEGEYKQALQYLDKAAKAPARPGRERADQGRRAEIAALAAKARARLG